MPFERRTARARREADGEHVPAQDRGDKSGVAPGLAPDSILALQRTAGNAAVARMFKSKQQGEKAPGGEKEEEEDDSIAKMLATSQSKAPKDTSSDAEWDDSGTVKPRDQRSRADRNWYSEQTRFKNARQAEDALLHDAHALPDEVGCPGVPIEKQIEIRDGIADRAWAHEVVAGLSKGLVGAAGTVVWGSHARAPAEIQGIPLPTQVGSWRLNWEVVSDWIRPSLRSKTAKHGAHGMAEIQGLVMSTSGIPNGQKEDFHFGKMTVTVKVINGQKWLWTVYDD
jgi:hypothetical protein